MVRCLAMFCIIMLWYRVTTFIPCFNTMSCVCLHSKCRFWYADCTHKKELSDFFSNPKHEALIASIIDFKIYSDGKILFAAILLKLLQVVYLIGILL